MRSRAITAFTKATFIQSSGQHRPCADCIEWLGKVACPALEDKSFLYGLHSMLTTQSYFYFSIIPLP